MNNYAKIYWLTRLDGINSFFVGMAVISILVLIAIIIYNVASKDFDEFESEKEVKVRAAFRTMLASKIKWLITTSLIGIIVSILLPTQNEAIIIVAGGKTMDFIQADTSITKIPEQTTLIISQFLENKIKELNEPEENK
jgi:TRAP-type C4-dicarboxylate transport system permease large subunit